MGHSYTPLTSLPLFLAEPFSVKCYICLSLINYVYFSVRSYITSFGTVIIKSATYVPYLVTLLPQGRISEDYNVTIKVEISDQKGSNHEEMLTVKVRAELMPA